MKNELLDNYRKAYVTIKTFPFIYTVTLLVLSPLEAWMSLRCAEVLALLTCTSIPTAWLCWRLSKVVKLCPWHRAQCFLMLLPLSIPLCRMFLPEINIFWVLAGVAVLLTASLINAYFVFIKPSVYLKRKK